MSARATLPVAATVAKIQTAIENARTSTERKALCWVAETILMDAERYGGFGYMYPHDSREFDEYARRYIIR